jgi:hypothetical protein
VGHPAALLKVGSGEKIQMTVELGAVHWLGFGREGAISLKFMGAVIKVFV